MLITIVRDSNQPVPDRTLGILYFQADNGLETLVGHTIEQPWKNNLKGHSCIPIGSYKLLPHDSPKHGKVVVFVNPLLDVYSHEEDIPSGKTGRSECLIHSGNYVIDVQGCVALGLYPCDFGSPHGLGVSHSKEAMADIQSIWGNRQGLRAIIK